MLARRGMPVTMWMRLSNALTRCRVLPGSVFADGAMQSHEDTHIDARVSRQVSRASRIVHVGCEHSAFDNANAYTECVLE
jgi:hypothetical protein